MASTIDDADHAPLASFRCGVHRLAVATDYAEDQDRIARRLSDKLGSLDLLEPFTRIQAAIDEARQQVRS